MPARGRPSRETVYQRFAAAIEELDRFGGLPRPGETKQIWDDIWHLEAHNSTALEGNTLVLREVATLLEEGRAVGAKALKDYMEVLGYSEAARWVYGQGIDPGDWTTGEIITLTEVRTVHRVLMTKVWEVAPHPGVTPRESPGNFRTHDLHPFGGGMQPPPHPQVPATITDWVADVVSFGAKVKAGKIDPHDVPEGLATITAVAGVMTMATLLWVRLWRSARENRTLGSASGWSLFRLAFWSSRCCQSSRWEAGFGIAGWRHRIPDWRPERRLGSSGPWVSVAKCTAVRRPSLL